MVNDPYKVLGVSPDADAETIKQAYRKLAKQYHPDLHPGDEYAAKRMNEINEAYEMIKNPQAYRQQQQQQAYQRQSYSQPGQNPFSGWQYTYTHTQNGAEQDDQGPFQWTVYRSPRRGGCLIRVIIAYLIFQLFFSLFSGCARFLFAPYSTYYQPPQSAYSETYRAPEVQNSSDG